MAFRFRTLRILRNRGVAVGGTVAKHVGRDTGADAFWVEFVAHDGSHVTRKLTARDRDAAVRLVYDLERPSRSLRADLVEGSAYSLVLWMAFLPTWFWVFLGVVSLPD